MPHNIWNFEHPLRTGYIRLAPSGKEIFGTVFRHGKMDKTVTVSYPPSLVVGPHLVTRQLQAAAMAPVLPLAALRLHYKPDVQSGVGR